MLRTDGRTMVQSRLHDGLLQVLIGVNFAQNERENDGVDTKTAMSCAGACAEAGDGDKTRDPFSFHGSSEGARRG